MCGHAGSTTNFGTSMFVAGRGVAARVRREPAIMNATITVKTRPELRHNNLRRAPVPGSGQACGTRTRFLFASIVILLFGVKCDRTDSIGAQSANGISNFVVWHVHRTILLPRTQ